MSRTMFKLARILSFLLVLGLVLPVCTKAFAPSASAAASSQFDRDGDDAPANAPCLSCCGGWTALLPAFVLPEPKQSKFAVLPSLNKAPAPQTLAAFAVHDPPPEWRLSLALPHSYAHMHARTDRLLL